MGQLPDHIIGRNSVRVNVRMLSVCYEMIGSDNFLITVTVDIDTGISNCQLKAQKIWQRLHRNILTGKK